jgi:hypothetical protein
LCKAASGGLTEAQSAAESRIYAAAITLSRKKVQKTGAFCAFVLYKALSTSV